MAEMVRLADYRVAEFLVDSVDLIFVLDPARTQIRTRLAVRRNPAGGGGALRLDGEALERGAVLLDGEPVVVREVAGGIELDVGEAGVLDIETFVCPAANSEFSGLYVSGGSFFTQCEAEGFRRITYFPDRPDVMSRFSTTIIADPASCPVMLSNGNRIDGGVRADGRHWVKWADPHPKPCYLFALVAGDLLCIADRFVTRSGRDVALAIYVRRGDEDKCGHAMTALKQSMAWDEQVFGLEYDLDVFNIAAVSDFNMGAMENKGLNIFNTKYVLARPDTATDADYEGIETVIAHEYFHNWTGNRVTCRDWFQLSLKEGLTVYRDQEFSADQGSRAVKRIGEVRRLRAAQFPEDAGPLAHPVRPASYVKIDNFYTATVYQKGAEVVRMICSLIGPAAFRAGMDLYFARHDYSAVRIEDFAQAMADASGVDLSQFARWYGQAGTPEVRAEERYDADERTFYLTLRQHTAPTPGQPDKQVLVIPVAMGLLDGDGSELATRLSGEAEAVAGTRVLQLTEAVQIFTFVDVMRTPVVSLLRGFSAPVRLVPPALHKLRFLATHDTDAFVRWESGQLYAAQLLLDAVALAARGEAIPLDDGLVEMFGSSLRGAMDDPAFAAEALRLPSESYLADQMAVVDVENIHAAREFFRTELAKIHQAAWLQVYAACVDGGPYRPDGASIGRRALKNLALTYLAGAGETQAAQAQFDAQANMTDVLAALVVLEATGGEAGDVALAVFHAQWRGEDLVLDKWFAIQAASARPDALARVKALRGHPDFELRNPNRMRALIGGFAMGNALRFHAADGSGYDFLADTLLELDPINSQVAARMVAVFGQWRRHEPGRGGKMRVALERIRDAGVSAATAEMVARSLG